MHERSEQTETRVDMDRVIRRTLLITIAFIVLAPFIYLVTRHAGGSHIYWWTGFLLVVGAVCRFWGKLKELQTTITTQAIAIAGEIFCIVTWREFWKDSFHTFLHDHHGYFFLVVIAIAIGLLVRGLKTKGIGGKGGGEHGSSRAGDWVMWSFVALILSFILYMGYSIVVRDWVLNGMNSRISTSMSYGPIGDPDIFVLPNVRTRVYGIPGTHIDLQVQTDGEVIAYPNGMGPGIAMYNTNNPAYRRLYGTNEPTLGHDVRSVDLKAWKREMVRVSYTPLPN